MIENRQEKLTWTEEQSLAVSALEIDKILNFEGGLRVRRVSWKRSGAYWKLVICVLKGGLNLVTFIDGHDPFDCFDIFFRLWKQNKVSWYPDRFA